MGLSDKTFPCALPLSLECAHHTIGRRSCASAPCTSTVTRIQQSEQNQNLWTGLSLGPSSPKNGSHNLLVQPQP